MNSKIAILATALGLALASSVDAQTIVRLTGSTAFRGSVHDAIKVVMPNANIAFFGATTLNSATRANFSGTFNNQPYIIQVSWSGSGAGIEAVAKNLDVTFLSSTAQGSTSGVQITDTNATEVGKADAALSDVFQASTPFTTPKLTDNRVCVVPFLWIANDGAPANFTNMTPGLAQNLYGAQFMPLSLFTGSTADRTAGTQVYGLGRDPDSGTRITMTAEAGLGAFATVFQSIVSQSGDTISGPSAYPAGTTTFGDGNNGYSSGGGLAGALAAKSGDGNVYLGYLGLGDANNTAIPGGARALTWNGVTYSATAVQEGQYTFWGYEHLFYTTSFSSNTAKFPIVTAVKNQLALVPGTAGLKLTDMKVSRASDGAPVGAN